MTITRLHICVFLVLAVLVWVVVLLVQGTSVSLPYLAPFGTVVAVLSGFSWALEHRLWRMDWLQGWFIKRPDLRGTWRVTIQSDWGNPETPSGPSTIEGYMGVAQTLSRLQMHLMTPESESWFIASSIRPSPSDVCFQVVGVYANKPAMLLRGLRSEMHAGAVVLLSHGENPARPKSLSGEYWTDRKTAGEITLTRRVPTVFTRYEDAHAALRSQASYVEGRHDDSRPVA